jgi:hypothetical protein
MNLEYLSAWLSSISLIGAFLWHCFALYFSCTMSNQILANLQRSPRLCSRAPETDAGAARRIVWFIEISAVVLTPKNHLRSGDLSAEDSRDFPVNIRTRLSLMRWVIWGCVCLLLISLLVDPLLFPQDI